MVSCFGAVKHAVKRTGAVLCRPHGGNISHTVTTLYVIKCELGIILNKLYL